MGTIRAGDINLEYYVEGSGPPLMMIMGFAGSARSWGEPFLEELRKHFTITRFSNRGMGESDAVTQPFTTRMMADDTAHLLEALGTERTHVLGISMGGMIAEEVVINYPERVNRLVLGCTMTGFASSVQASPETLAKMAPDPQAQPREMIERFWEVICSADFRQRGRAFLDAMTEQSMAQPTPRQMLGLQIMAIQQHDALARMGQIKAPTLVIHGDGDMLIPPENGKRVAAAITGSELLTVPVVGHMWFWEEPQKTANAVVEFLLRVPAQAENKGITH